ncbi:MAG: YicC/YloC family endoribonuclease, partial [Thermoanaerobaculia bacterium]
MTGYGEASGENPRHGITVSLRAVNHRFLDLQLRIGEELRGSEAALRD